MLKVLPWKGVVRFGKKGKLSLIFVGPFEILERIGPVAYRLRLPEELSSVHDTFHVSNLKKCLADANLHVPLDEIKVDKTLHFVEEPLEIMDREVKTLKRSKIPIMKVRWNFERGPEFTWEREDHMKANSMGDNVWHKVTRKKSMEDLTQRISKSVFITNFPDHFSARDLWMVYKGYGTVVDVYIPNRKSKAGKRYAFVRFIRVDNMERLVNNLCTVWNGRLHMHANVVRFDRPAKPTNRPIRTETPAVTTYASVHKGIKPNNTPVVSIPSMVLDDSHIVHRDLSFHVMGEAKQFMSIQKLPTILSKEGFSNVKLTYLGGLWVMMEFSYLITKEKFLHHVEVASWFDNLSNAQPDFVSKERIVWVDIKGVPLHLWSHATFTKIGSKWSELLEMEELKDDLFSRKRLCVKTKQEDNILENFKILIRGKAFVI
ncbi:RNA-directed DNA polymerase, eukaryota [Tanacetum coccineum]